MKIQLLGVVSDLHCGSNVGLCPPEVETEAGNKVSHGDNLHQKWLWEMWQEGIGRFKKIVGKSPVALMVNGDATEGAHHRNEKDLVLAMDLHTGIAVECLRPLTKLCAKVFVTKGTECHTLDMENVLADKLGAESGRAHDKWLLEMGGCLIDAAHHMTTTSRAHLEAGAMSILMSNAALNYARSKQRIPNIFLRAHRHCGGWYSDGSGMFVVTGAWQMLTRHGHKVVTDSIPRPSIMILDWRGRPEGSLPQIHEIKFAPPQHEIHKV
jgi:hypothetical protein